MMKLMKLNGMQTIAFLAVMLVLIQSAHGIHISVSGGGSDGSGSVSTSIDAAKDAAVNSGVTINGADLRPITNIQGTAKTFEQTHRVDRSGKTAQVYVNVVNAPSISYGSLVLPDESKEKNQGWVSAEQWLTVPKADSITCTASASHGGAQSADVGISETKGPSSGDYVTLTGYDGKAYASPTQVSAVQTATGGSGNSITISGNAKDGSRHYGVSTPLSGSFNGLNAASLAGRSAQVSQAEQILGSFSSTATSPGATKTRISNFGAKYDLNMLAAQGSSPIGTVGYYVDPSMATTTSGAIQSGVNAAQSGDTINAAAGTYKENVIIDKSLALIGAGAGSDPAKNTIVDGHQAGTVLTVGSDTNRNLDVTLSGMTIQGGSGTSGIYEYADRGPIGGGILNYGTLNVDGNSITGNTGYEGGGIANIGTLNLYGGSITDNTGNFAFGGILNYYSGTLNMYGGSISSNRAGLQGGGIGNDGTFTMNGGSVTGNTAAYGGGIENDGPMTMNAGSIAGNTAWANGGGVASTDIFTMNGGSITGNTAGYWGGGIGLGGNLATTMIMNGGSITGNTAGYLGGGISAEYGSMTMNGGSIADNTANYGGGIILGQASAATMTMNGGSIAGNTANYGGGIYNYYSTVEMNKGSSIKSNTASIGGGIYNEGTGTVNMYKDSSIASNSARGFGGGIYNQGTVNMYKGSSITSNVATKGAGIFSWDSSGTLSSATVNMYAGSSIAGNTALWHGGGIWSYATVNMYKGSSIAGNIAERGGGIHNMGTVNMYKGSSIAGNTAPQGGGIYNTGTGTVAFKDSKGNPIAFWPGYDTNADPYGFFTPHNTPDDIYQA